VEALGSPRDCTRLDHGDEAFHRPDIHSLILWHRESDSYLFFSRLAAMLSPEVVFHEERDHECLSSTTPRCRRT
jgi:hypothetical protein